MARIWGRVRGKVRALLIVAGMVLMVTAATPSCDPGPQETETSTNAERVKVALFSRVNDERAARGLAPLAWDSTLASYGDNWSATMSSSGFRHSNIGSLLGPYSFIGENIAAGSAGVTAGSLHTAWMRSTWHRDNIVHEGFTRVGVGVYCAPDGGMWLTEVFGREIEIGLPPPGHTPAGPEPVARSDSGTKTC